MIKGMPYMALVRVLIVDRVVKCASQMCDKTCPNYDKCIEGALWTIQEGK